MRVLSILAAFTLVSGCSLLDQMSLNGPPKLDPNKVYLGSARVTNLSAQETGRYSCVGTPLICTQRGIGFDCHC